MPKAEDSTPLPEAAAWLKNPSTATPEQTAEDLIRQWSTEPQFEDPRPEPGQ